jgi:nucleotidyltransferase substrate binding protein (TIGR01987 family)
VKAHEQLSAAISISEQRALSNLEKQGLIQAFEFTHELAWNVIKDYFEHQGIAGITGPRDAVREAFQKGLIKQGDDWIEMIKSRNKTSHTYNLAVAEEIVEKIIHTYQPLFEAFKSKMLSLKSNG